MSCSWIGWDTQVSGNFTARFDWKRIESTITIRFEVYTSAATSFQIAQIYSQARDLFYQTLLHNDCLSRIQHSI